MAPETRVRAGANEEKSILVNCHRWVIWLRTTLQDKGASEDWGGAWQLRALMPKNEGSEMGGAEDQDN